MGYYMTIEDTKFVISQKHWAAALAAIKGLKVGAWVNESAGRATTIVTAMNAWRWEPHISEDTGDIEGVGFLGEKYGDEDSLWAALAPFVKSGSYILARGEDGAHWRWRFSKGQVFNEQGYVIYKKAR